jgi:hypothetical protein
VSTPCNSADFQLLRSKLSPRVPQVADRSADSMWASGRLHAHDECVYESELSAGAVPSAQVDACRARGLKLLRHMHRHNAHTGR